MCFPPKSVVKYKLYCIKAFSEISELKFVFLYFLFWPLCCLLRFMGSDYPFGIFKLFFQFKNSYKEKGEKMLVRITKYKWWVPHQRRYYCNDKQIIFMATCDTDIQLRLLTKSWWRPYILRSDDVSVPSGSTWVHPGF